MTCTEAEDLLLESLDDVLPVEIRRGLDLHVASCAGCGAFATRMRSLDVQLSQLLVPPPTPPLAAAVHVRQRRERLDGLAASLPDIIHVAGCTLATVASALLLPVEASITLAAGAGFTAISYIVLALIRSSMESAELPDW